MFLQDSRGLKCPLPVLKARRKMSELTIGDQLEILTTDPGAPADFRAYVETAGHILILEEIAEDMSARIIIQKG